MSSSLPRSPASLALLRLREWTKNDKGKILKVSWEGGADYYTAAKLDEIFKQFGMVEDIVIKTSKSKRKGSAIVVMASKEACTNCTEEPFCVQCFPVPLFVASVQESEGYQQGQLKHLNRGQATLMELFSDLEASVFQNFKRPRKGRNVDS
ncbi:hypothetical protein ZWY2020_031055 [Hordeum vulgare]|nr:hypothetical protein ZWY2020_031055 [Hordeum vulgare]